MIKRLKSYVVPAVTGSVILLAGNTAMAQSSSSASPLPPSAKAGECYAKVIIPAEYRTEQQTLVLKEAGERIEVVPAKYQMVEQRIQVKEASQKLIPVAASYETVSEKILVRPDETFWRIGKSANSKRASMTTVAGAGAAGLNLAGAQPGQCYREYAVPAKYEVQPMQVLKSEASFKVAVVPAKYQMVEERVMVKEASTRLVEVPATYETQSEQILVSAATTEWKKGRGLVEKVDHTTGEIMCLVEVPAVYKTVSKRVIKSPASTKTVEIPAEYRTQKVRKLVSAAQESRVEIPATYQTVNKRSKISDGRIFWALAGSASEGKATGRQLCMTQTPAQYRTITQRKVKTPASTRVVEIPAEFKTVKTRQLLSSAEERRIAIPEQTQVVTRKVKVTDEKIEWKSVLCETNMGAGTITSIQRALKNAGYNPGKIDGVVGRDTLTAVERYQREKGLPRGGLTMKTIETLGVKL